ncbi:MAG TPA: site-specific integrase [Methylomirabilota bacterium]|jgi:integrase/recombinase XerD|nr:site-specific integrase [Methylomirabilota bacterium]
MNGGRTKQGQAPILERADMRAFIAWCASTAYPERNEVIARLSFECGLRAVEIGNVRWEMAYGPEWQLRPRLQLHATASKGGYGGRDLRIVPNALGLALEQLRAVARPHHEHLFVVHFRKQSTEAVMRSKAVQAVFRFGFDAIGLDEASSHSGRRTAITLMSRAVGIRNAQTFAGHRNVATTLRYEEPDHTAIDRVVAEQLAVHGPRMLKMAKAALHDRAAHPARKHRVS